MSALFFTYYGIFGLMFFSFYSDRDRLARPCPLPDNLFSNKHSRLCVHRNNTLAGNIHIRTGRGALSLQVRVVVYIAQGVHMGAYFNSLRTAERIGSERTTNLTINRNYLTIA